MEAKKYAVRNETRAETFRAVQVARKSRAEAARNGNKAARVFFCSQYGQAYGRIREILSGLSDEHQRRQGQVALHLAYDADFFMELDQRQNSAQLPTWLLELDGFEGGRLPDLAWTEKFVEDEGIDGLVGAIWEVASRIEADLLPEEDASRVDWRKHWVDGYFEGKPKYPSRALRDVVKYHHLTSHVRGPAVAWDSPVPTRRDGYDEDAQTWADVVESNGAELSAIAAQPEEWAAYNKLAERARSWGLDFIKAGEFGPEVDWAHFEEYRRKDELLRDAASQMEKAGGFAGLEDVLKALNLNSVGLERTWQAVTANMAGKNVRPGQKNVGERHLEFVKALYAEEMEAAKRGEELSVRGAKWLDAGQKTGLSRVRNKALRALHGKA